MMVRNQIQGGALIIKEVKKLLHIAGPMFAASLLQVSLQPISLIFVGHLGEVALAAASIAFSFTSATGSVFLMGLSGGLDTLCGQSFGAEQYHMVGIHTQRAIFLLSLISIFIAVIWANTNRILIAAHQNSSISEEAGKFAIFMIPGLFAFGPLQCLNIFLRAQNNVYPMLLSSVVSTLFHLIFCWILVLKLELGIRGAALAISISYWVNLLVLTLYVKFSSSCAKTWTGFSKEAMQNISSFTRIAIPSATMDCLDMWFFEILVIASGLLPNSKLETSVFAICFATALMIWTIYMALGVAGSVRVSNELGAGQPQAARFAANVVIPIAIIEGLAVGTVMILLRSVWGHVFSTEKEVVEYVKIMMPIFAAYTFLDAMQTVLTGIARGCGRQKLWAWINLGCAYFLGLPIALVLAFVLHFKTKGLWLGILSAYFIQTLVFLVITIRTDWKKQADEAAKTIQG